MTTGMVLENYDIKGRELTVSPGPIGWLGGFGGCRDGWSGMELLGRK